MKVVFSLLLEMRTQIESASVALKVFLSSFFHSSSLFFLTLFSSFSQLGSKLWRIVRHATNPNFSSLPPPSSPTTSLVSLECAHLYYTFFSFFVQNEIIAGFGGEREKETQEGEEWREEGRKGDLEKFLALANENPSPSSPHHPSYSSSYAHTHEFEGGFPILGGSEGLFSSIFRYSSCLNMLDMTCQFLIGLLLRQQGWGGSVGGGREMGRGRGKGGGEKKEKEDSVHLALKSLLMCCFCDDINVSLIGIQSVISLLSYWKGTLGGVGRGVGGGGRLMGHFFCLWKWIGMIGRRLWGFLHPRYEDSHSHVSGLLVQLEVFIYLFIDLLIYLLFIN